MRRHHPEVLDHGGLVFDEEIFVRLDLRVALLHFGNLLRVPGAEPRHAHDAEAIRTHVGNLLGCTDPTMNQGGDGEQSSGRQHNSEQRQKTAHLFSSESTAMRVASQKDALSGNCFDLGTLAVDVDRRQNVPLENEGVVCH